jgi:hypothetical protein
MARCPQTQDDTLTDEFVESYVRWREECEAVRAAYERLAGSAPDRRDLDFAMYRAALYREELAAGAYQRSVERLAVRGPR